MSHKLIVPVNLSHVVNHYYLLCSYPLGIKLAPSLFWSCLTSNHKRELTTCFLVFCHAHILIRNQVTVCAGNPSASFSVQTGFSPLGSVTSQTGDIHDVVMWGTAVWSGSPSEWSCFNVRVKDAKAVCSDMDWGTKTQHMKDTVYHVKPLRTKVRS